MEKANPDSRSSELLHGNTIVPRQAHIGSEPCIVLFFISIDTRPRTYTALSHLWGMRHAVRLRIGHGVDLDFDSLA